MQVIKARIPNLLNDGIPRQILGMQVKLTLINKLMHSDLIEVAYFPRVKEKGRTFMVVIMGRSPKILVLFGFSAVSYSIVNLLSG